MHGLNFSYYLRHSGTVMHYFYFYFYLFVYLFIFFWHVSGGGIRHFASWHCVHKGDSGVLTGEARLRGVFDVWKCVDLYA